MSLWTFLAIVGVVAILAESYNKRQKTLQKMSESAWRDSEVLDRIARLEERVENLESLLIEHEKTQRFDEALR